MKRIPPIVWALLIFGAFYVVFEYGVAPLTGILTGAPAPLPSSLVWMYVGMVALAILLYFSVQDERWRAFVQPIFDFLRDPTPPSSLKRVARKAILVLIPLLAGWQGYTRTTTEPEPPADPPGIHFNLPNQYILLTNPLPWTEENIRAGGILYTKNCAICHGDAQDGNGLFARAWQPRPANFRDSGTIAQLDENYLYWRIKEGSPGLPKGSIEYRSTMPAWEGFLTDEEIWKIIMFEYTNAGVQPAKRE
ncbi:MAG: c-type cytochrome [Terriglobia bacterium]